MSNGLSRQFIEFDAKERKVVSRGQSALLTTSRFRASIAGRIAWARSASVAVVAFGLGMTLATTRSKRDNWRSETAHWTRVHSDERAPVGHRAHMPSATMGHAWSIAWATPTHTSTCHGVVAKTLHGVKIVASWTDTFVAETGQPRSLKQVR